MKAFLSYSVSNTDSLVIPRILSLLQGRQVLVNVSERNEVLIHPKAINRNNFDQIQSSHLFIGLITKGSRQADNVLEEWRFAQKNYVPCIVLVEKGVALPSSLIQYPNVILFDKHNQEGALELINQKIAKAFSKMNSTLQPLSLPTAPMSQNNNALAWFIGGAMVGMIIGALTIKD